MYRVVTMYGTDEPWWFFEGWKEEIVSVDEFDDFYKAYEMIESRGNIRITGIHYFSGTQKKLSKICDEVKLTEQLVEDLKNKIQLDNLYIEYGPGLSYEYFGDDFSDNVNKHI